MTNEMVIDQPTSFHEPNKNSEKQEDNVLPHSSNQTRCW